MEIKQESKKLVIQCIFLIAILILGIQNLATILTFLSKLWKIAYPLILGAIIAYILNLLLIKLEKYYFRKSTKVWVRKSKRAICIILSILLILGLATLIVRLVVPEFIEAVGMLSETIPIYYNNIIQWLLENTDPFPSIENILLELKIDWEQVFQYIVTYVSSGITGIANFTLSAVSIVVGGIINFCIAVIFAIYILYNKEKLFDQCRRIIIAYIPEKRREKIFRTISISHETFSNFIVGQITEAVILGSLCTLGMLGLNLPYAPMIGAFIGVTALVPIVGAYLGAALGAFMILTVAPLKAIVFIIFIVLLQQIEGNLIYPKVVGSSVGLPAIWVLAAVTIGGGLMGIIGMIIGVPLGAILYKLIRLSVNERIANKEIGAEGLEQKEKEQASLNKEHTEEETEESV